MDNQPQPTEEQVEKKLFFLKITLLLIIICGVIFTLINLKNKGSIFSNIQTETNIINPMNVEQPFVEDIANMDSFDEVAKKYSSNASIFYNLGGKVAYGIDKDRWHMFIVYDGKEFGKEYESAHSPAIVNGKLAYIAVQDNKMVIVYDGKEIGKEYSSPDLVLTGITDLTGKIAYIVSTTLTNLSQSKSFIVYDGKEFGKEYDNATHPAVINGKLVYEAKKDGKKFFVYDGKEIGKEYDILGNPIDVGGKMVWVAVKNNKGIIFYDGKEIGGEYDNIDSPTAINGKLVYIAKKDGKAFIVYDGKEIDGKYDSIDFPIGIKGKLAYMVKRDGKEFIVYDGKEIGKEYDYIISSKVFNINEKLAYVVLKDNKQVIVYDGKEYPLLYSPDNPNNFTLASTEGGYIFIIQKDNKIVVLSEK
jgi:hypothetical protein